MITSLVLSKPLTIGVNANGKLNVNGISMSVTDVPSVRYRFKQELWEAAALQDSAESVCIAKHMKNFPKSVHIAEIQLCNGTESIIRYLNTAFEKLAVFVYVSVDDDVVRNEAFGAYIIALLSGLRNVRIDRLMMRDNSTMLYTIVYNKLVAGLCKVSGIAKENIGICCSPLSIGGNCCLTAIKARELAAKYGDTADMVIPSANHEGKNCSTCGCIRYTVVNDSSAAPIIKKAVGGLNAGDKKDTINDEQSGENDEQDSAKKKKSSKVVKPWF